MEHPCAEAAPTVTCNLPGSKSEELLQEFVKEIKTFQKGIWEGDLGGGTQAAKVKTFFKSLLRK